MNDTSYRESFPADINETLQLPKFSTMNNLYDNYGTIAKLVQQHEM